MSTVHDTKVHCTLRLLIPTIAYDPQSILGFIYRKGDGIGKDDTVAFKWYEQAAHQGKRNAQFHLGTMYQMGEGVEKNEQLALTWFQKAAEQGHREASVIVSVLTAKLDEGAIINGAYENEQLGWTFPIPKGWWVFTEKETASLERTINQVLRKNTDPAIGKKEFTSILNLRRNYALFFSITEGGELALNTEGKYETYKTTMFQQVIDSNIHQNKGIDRKISRILLGGLWFDSLDLTVYSSPEKKTENFRQIYYVRLFNDRVLTIVLTYINENDKTAILKSLQNSKFTQHADGQ